MNEILKQRIDEAARKEYPLPPLSDGAVKWSLVAAEQYAFEKGATFALQNQWISVEEALPEEKNTFIFLRCESDNLVTYITDYLDEHVEGAFINTPNPVGNRKVTHWMPNQN